MVKELKEDQIPIKQSCRVLEVSRSAYYAWCQRLPSKRQRDDIVLIHKIKAIHQESKQTYGLPRITAELKNQGETCNKKRVHRLMKKENLFGIARKQFKPQTTDSKHDYPIADRHFKTEEDQTHPTKSNQVWASDITYIPTEEGWVYLAVFLDVFSRKIEGHAMASHMKTTLVLKALSQAFLKWPLPTKRDDSLGSGSPIRR